MPRIEDYNRQIQCACNYRAKFWATTKTMTASQSAELALAAKPPRLTPTSSSERWFRRLFARRCIANHNGRATTTYMNLGDDVNLRPSAGCIEAGPRINYAETASGLDDNGACIYVTEGNVLTKHLQLDDRPPSTTAQMIRLHARVGSKAWDCDETAILDDNL